MARLHFRTGPILLVAVSLNACLLGRPEENPFDPNRVPREVTIYVTNLAFSDATVYGVTTGNRVRLGTVTGKKEAVFKMPLPFPTEMHMEIDLLAGPRCLTDRITVDPGDELELIIQNEGANLLCRA